MHYDIDYSGLKGQAKIDKALQDTKDWLGEDKLNKIIEIVKGDMYTLSQFRLALSFAGVKGYPVCALYIHIWGQEKFDEEYTKELDEDKQEVELVDTTDPTMPMGPNGNRRVD